MLGYKQMEATNNVVAQHFSSTHSPKNGILLGNLPEKSN